MKEFTVGKNDANQRLDRWLSKNLPLLPAPLAQKYIRLKRVKLNGKGAKRDTRLQVGDLLQLYINDEFFEIPTPENAFLKLFKPKLDILYEDEHILLVNKTPGMVVHGDETERVNTLINHIQAYLYQKKEWNPFREHAFAPALCNRIDRNTGGIVIAAKTAEALRVMNQKIRDRELVKLYLCAIVGQIQPPDGTLKGYLWKDEAKKQVFVKSRPVPGARTAVTKYRTLTSGRAIPTSSATWRLAAPTKSVPNWLPPVIPSWAMANTAARSSIAATGCAARPSGPGRWSSGSPPLLGSWNTSTDSAFRSAPWISRRNIFLIIPWRRRQITPGTERSSL